MGEASPLFSVYKRLKAALAAVSRTIQTEWTPHGVHSTTLYHPLVATPMIAPTKALRRPARAHAEEAGRWMIDAARRRPGRIAPRIAITARALTSSRPASPIGAAMRQRIQPTTHQFQRVS